MTEVAGPQSVSFWLDSGHAIYCPLCGWRVSGLGEAGAEEWSADPCPHLAFAYVNEPGCFAYVSEEFARRAGIGIGEDQRVDAVLEETLAVAAYDDQLLVLETVEGFPGGGSMSVVHGFDFSATGELES